jgi:hypothetical protein
MSRGITLHSLKGRQKRTIVMKSTQITIISFQFQLAVQRKSLET